MVAKHLDLSDLFKVRRVNSQCRVFSVELREKMSQKQQLIFSLDDLAKFNNVFQNSHGTFFYSKFYFYDGILSQCNNQEIQKFGTLFGQFVTSFVFVATRFSRSNPADMHNLNTNVCLLLQNSAMSLTELRLDSDVELSAIDDHDLLGDFPNLRKLQFTFEKSNPGNGFK